MIWLLFIPAMIYVFSVLYLRGESFKYLDEGIAPAPVGEPSAEHYAVVERLKEFTSAGAGLRGKKRLETMRAYMDSMSDGGNYESTFTAVQDGNIKGEWVVAPGANPRRRILYIHGGAFIAGSPKSHRTITNRYSELTGAAVFSLDYRLMPEHYRQLGIDDCREAYRWILKNGPDGEQDLDFLVVSGDSAGGNLTLSTIAWVRDTGLRAPDAAVALSPATDGTMTGETLRTNIDTDPMLGPAFGKLGKVPKLILWWVSLLSNRISPSQPSVSPLHGDLSGLPPVLVQASEAEMLFDDARRYVRKAQLAGSPVELQSWPFMVHVWQMFSPDLPEAEDAYVKIVEFLNRVEKPQVGAASA